jgi:rhodanese-related sulfurtransferase
MKRGIYVKLKIDLYRKRDALSILLVTAVVMTACSDKTAEVTRILEPIAQTAAKREDRVTAEQIADWIISKRQDYRLIDIRSKEAFDTGHIEGAENIPLATLILPDSLQSLPAERKLVLYGNGSEQAAKASVMLRLAGFDAYLLLGGYNHWQDRILNPDIPAEAADDETPEQALQRAISCYFAAPGERTVRQLPTPEVQATKPKGFTPPLGPAGGGLKPPKDEGC